MRSIFKGKTPQNYWPPKMVKRPGPLVQCAQFHFVGFCVHCLGCVKTK